MADIALAGNVFCGVYRNHTGHFFGFVGVDGEDFGACVLGEYIASVAHAIKYIVVGVFGRTQGFRQCIDAEHFLSDAAQHFIGGDFCVFADDLCRQQNGVFNLLIPCAAADIEANGRLDFFPCGIVVGVDQALGGHDHARDAKAALHGIAFGKRIAVYIFVAVGQAFYRNDGFSFDPGQFLGAGARGFSVD